MLKIKNDLKYKEMTGNARWKLQGIKYTLLISIQRVYMNFLSFMFLASTIMKSVLCSVFSAQEEWKIKPAEFIRITLLICIHKCGQNDSWERKVQRKCKENIPASESHEGLVLPKERTRQI